MAIIFVDINASGRNNGNSFADAFTDLQSALAIAGNGDQIFVADGTYMPTDSADRDISFVIPSGVEIFGGFSGSETELSQRNLNENITILSGNIGSNAAGDNSHHVVNISNTSASTILDGFTIADGRADQPNEFRINREDGAGIFGDDANARLSNLVITNNSAINDGGGIFLEGSSNTGINNIIFFDNAASDNGGAIYIAGTNNSAAISNNLFIENSSTGGGAIHTNSIGTLNVVNNTFSNNQGNIADAIFDDTFLTNGNRSIGNNIFADDAAIPNTQVFLEDTRTNGTITINNNLIQGSSTLPGTGDVIGGSNLVNVNPLFIDPANNDFRLQLTSPGIDSGDSSFIGTPNDLANNPRVQNTAVDRGAFESNGMLPTNALRNLAIEPNIIYVDINATGGNNGSSFANAFTDLQSALAIAGNGDQIFVAAGTYIPTSTADRDISFVIPSGVEIFGGFAGTETELSQRNIEANITILSGNIGSNAAGDNSHHVVDISNTSASTILDGFTIADGRADASNGFRINREDGAGIFGDDANARLSNLIVLNNSALDDGGGLFLDGSSAPTINNVSFLDNSASDNGGAIYVSGSTNSLNVTNSLFIDNQSTGGGAIHTNSIGTLNVVNNTFSDNQGGIADALFDDTFLTNGSRTIANNIFADSATIPNTQLFLEDTRTNGTITISNNLIQGAATLPGTNDVIGTGNLTDTNPLFVDAANNDFSLQLFSPGLNTGDNSLIGIETDRLGNPRIVNQTVDIGAIEFDRILLSIDDAAAILEGDAGNSNAQFTVNLMDTPTEEITVNFTTVAGTATAGSDFGTTAGTLIFSPGITTQTINVPIIGDQLLESDETFTVELSGVNGNAAIIDGSGEITITNDDLRRQIAIADATITEGNSGTSSLDFTVSLDQSSVETITVDFNLVDNIATAGQDFTSNNGTITFNPGETEQTLSVTVSGDQEFEANETFFVQLSNPNSAAIIQDGQAIGTITNDDQEETTSTPLIDALDTSINRFQNSDLPGTFLFAGENESNSIRTNFPQFVEEGTAFRVADEAGEGLIPIFRFQSRNTPGTFVFVEDAERQSINANFSADFVEEGVAFFVFGASSGIGETFTRFQNSDRPGTFLFANEAESNSIRANFPQFIEEGAAFNVAI